MARTAIRFWRLAPRPRGPLLSKQPPPVPPGIYLDTRTSGVSTTQPLERGKQYTITVQGTYSDWDLPLDHGAPLPAAMYPTDGARASTQVGLDAETIFAYPTGHAHSLGHWTQLQIDTGSGFKHVEPEGGPFSQPDSDHSYTYHVVGAGSVARFRVADTPLGDNYGKLRIEVA